MDASIYRLRLCDILALCVLALLAFGLIMVQSASASAIGEPKFGWSPLGWKDLIFVTLSIPTFFIVGRLDYSWLGHGRHKEKGVGDPSWNTRVLQHSDANEIRTTPDPLFTRGQVSVLRSPVLWAWLIAAASCAVVLVPHIGNSVNGARRWLPLGPIQVQPSELAKWATVLFLAYRLTRPNTSLERFFQDLLPTLIPIVILSLLVVIQDFGTAALIMLCGLTMLLAGRVKIRHLAILVVPVLAAAAWFIMHKEYRMRRITAFLHPWDNPQGEGYHMIQSLLCFSTGGLSGRGLGNGIQKLGYLPEDTTDFIFAVICEELGFFGAMLTIALYLGILYVAWQVVRQKRDSFGRMLVFGIGSMIGLQAAINIAVATVSVPTKGLSLPLISAGGSGLIITCAALGLLYSVTRTGEEYSSSSEPETIQDDRVERHRRPLRSTA